jgi:hypothetical protein
LQGDDTTQWGKEEDLLESKRAGWRRAQLGGAQTRLKSGEPITLKKLGAAKGAAGQELQPFRRKTAFVGEHAQR